MKRYVIILFGCYNIICLALRRNETKLSFATIIFEIVQQGDQNELDSQLKM